MSLRARGGVVQNWPVGAVFGRAICAAQRQKTLAFSFVIQGDGCRLVREQDP
jgi:hypothetical protein